MTDIAKPKLAERLQAYADRQHAESAALRANIPRPNPRAALAHTASTFQGVRIEGDRIHYRSESQPVTGARAEVQTAGELSRRATLTRAVAGGFLFGRTGAVVGALMTKKVDTRKVYLLIEGTERTWLVPVPVRAEGAARRYAVEIANSARA